MPAVHPPSRLLFPPPAADAARGNAERGAGAIRWEAVPTDTLLRRSSVQHLPAETASPSASPGEEVSPDLARKALLGVAVHWPEPLRLRGRAVEVCRDLATVLPATMSGRPEFALMRALGGLAASEKQALLAAFDASPWLRGVLAKEVPARDAAAREAQANRLHLLGRMLHLCHALKLDLAGFNAEVYALLSRVPSVDARAALWQCYVKHLGGSSAEWDSLVRATQAHHPSVEARILALLLANHPTPAGQKAQVLTDPAALALLNSSALARDGEAWRRLVDLFLGGSFWGEQYALRVATWGTVPRLVGLLPHAIAADSPLQQARAWAAQPDGAGEALRTACARSEATSKAAAVLVEALRPEAESAEAITRYAEAERARLRKALAFLRGQPGLQPLSDALLSIVGKAESTATDSALAQALRVQAKALPRGPLADWLRDLLRQTLRVAAPPPKRPKPVELSALYAQAPVRHLFNHHGVPLALELQRAARIAYHANISPFQIRDLSDLRQQVFARAAQQDWPALWERLQSRVDEPENLLLYGMCAPDWQPPYREAAASGYRAVLQAVVEDRYDTLRRTSPQMTAVLKHAAGRALLPAWEHAPKQAVDIDGVGHVTLTDTANVGAMLAAVTDLRSCQAVDNYHYNIGMLNRMQCGSKRLLTVRGPNGKLVARAMVRLMLAEDTPVLCLSRIYTVALRSRDPVDEAVVKYLQERAQSLGVRAARTFLCSEGGDSIVVSSAAHPIPDYWDERRDLTARAFKTPAWLIDSARERCVKSA